MNRQTLTALRGSIRKWELIVAGKGVDSGARNCPLCKLFATGQGCAGCPVSEATGLNDCNDTPYVAWQMAHFDADRYTQPNRIHADDTAIAAVFELEFLRSLLPSKK